MTATAASHPQSWTRSFGFGFTSLLVGTLGLIFAVIPIFALAAVIHGSLALGFGLPVIKKNEGSRMAAGGVLLGVAAIGLGTWALVAA